MKLIWLGYLVYSLVNYTIKLCIETGLSELLCPFVVEWFNQVVTTIKSICKDRSFFRGRPIYR